MSDEKLNNNEKDDDIQYSFGAMPDKEDARDFVICTASPEVVATLPPSADISDKILIIKNQGQEGTCVANAGTEFKEFMDREQLSVRYLYYRGREIYGLPPVSTPGVNEGMSPRDMMKCLLERGVCKESLWPYKLWDKGAPTPEMDKDAVLYKVKSYSRIYTINDLKAHIANNRIPAVLTVPIYDNAVNWYNSNVKANNNTIKSGGNKRTSGHAILVVGYDDNRGALKILNSWGGNWADGGYAWLPYDYAWSDCWTGIDTDGLYDFEWMEKQSEYPTVKPGETALLTMAIKNIGTANWEPGKFNIGIPGDKPSRLYNETWLDLNRPATVASTVGPGEEALIEISITVPLNAKPGDVWKLDVCPVVEGLTWLKNIGIFWDITIG